jgi:arylsulfatase A-like enzyme
LRTWTGIIQELDEAGLSLNTHIMFFSDHGDMHGSHGQFRKSTPYEEAIRIPFIISGEQPSAYNNRRVGRFTAPLNHVDIAPTTLGLCGIDLPAWMDGTDYSHYRIKKESTPCEPDSAYLQCVVPSGHANSVDRAWRGIVTRDGWKYICLEGTPWLMFNLNEDFYEEVNLAFNSRYGEERKKLNKRLKEWVIQTDDRFILPEF